MHMENLAFLQEGCHDRVALVSNRCERVHHYLGPVIRLAVQDNGLAETERLRVTQYRLHGQYQLIDAVLVRDGAVTVEIMRGLTDTRTVQITTAAPTERFILADRHRLHEMITRFVARQIQDPVVVTARAVVQTRNGVPARLPYRICIFVVIPVMPIVRMSPV